MTWRRLVEELGPMLFAIVVTVAIVVAKWPLGNTYPRNFVVICLLVCIYGFTLRNVLLVPKNFSPI